MVEILRFKSKASTEAGACLRKVSSWARLRAAITARRSPELLVALAILPISHSSTAAAASSASRSSGGQTTRNSRPISLMSRVLWAVMEVSFGGQPVHEGLDAETGLLHLGGQGLLLLLKAGDPVAQDMVLVAQRAAEGRHVIDFLFQGAEIRIHNGKCVGKTVPGQAVSHDTECCAAIGWDVGISADKMVCCPRCPRRFSAHG